MKGCDEFQSGLVAKVGQPFGMGFYPVQRSVEMVGQARGGKSFEGGQDERVPREANGEAREPEELRRENEELKKQIAALQKKKPQPAARK